MTTPGRRRGALLALMMLLAAAAPATAQPLRLILPTDNDALFRDDGPAFYQYTDRYFERRRSRPWQGGKYGFYRNPRRTGRRSIVYTRFHEGIDIQPVRRDAEGEPLDDVRAIDDGLVVYVNAVADRSNYGKYVVVEHWWGGAPFYTLSAHLNTVAVRAGQRVRQGQALGRLGYTGVGINRRRAHVHFEINLLINRDFQRWYDRYFEPDDVNHHGIYSGLNLMGLDVPALYLALRDDPDLTLPQFIARQKPYFAVTVPAEGMLDLLYRYPWLSPTLNPWMLRAEEVRLPAAWRLVFSQPGLPLSVEPSDEILTAPRVEVYESAPVDYRLVTDGLLTGASRRDVTLAREGRRYIDLLTRPYEPLHRRLAW